MGKREGSNPTSDKIAQQAQINQLTQEIERLKASLNLDSQTSSKPPSTDLLKKKRERET